MAEITSINECWNNIRKEFTLNSELFLDFGKCRIVLKTNSPELTQKLIGYFKGFVAEKIEEKEDIVIEAIEGNPPEFKETFTIKTPDLGKKKIKEEYLDLNDGRIVRKRLTGMVFLFGAGKNYAIGNCIENDNQVINFINNRFIEWLLKQKYLLAHAAAVIHKGKGIAMAGFSGAGKSTLALHLMSKGCEFVSNDRLLVKRNGNGVDMRGVAKLPRINPGTALNNEELSGIIPEEERETFNKMLKEELWELEQKYDVYIDQCFGEGKFFLESSVDLIVILNWKLDNGPTKVTQVNFNERRDLLEAFMKPVGLFYDIYAEIPPHDEEAYLQELQGIPVLEFSGSVDFEKAVNSCIDFFNKG
ncbi:MAG: HprK-related kinase B [Nitrospinae bacterium]|nr:HprK-related kinase B [Nitrospinota bacterium]